MNLLKENIIPGNHGKIFGTNATSDDQMNKIKTKLLTLDGVKDVIIVQGVFPKEFIVNTTKTVSVIAIENAVKSIGLHAIPKGLFGL